MTTWRFCFNLARIPQTRMRTIPCFMTLRAPFGSGSTDKSGQRAHCLSSEGVIAVVGNYESATSFKSEPQLCMHRRLRDLRRSRSPPIHFVGQEYGPKVAQAKSLILLQYYRRTIRLTMPQTANAVVCPQQTAVRYPYPQNDRPHGNIHR